MNYFTKLSIELANQRDYLDQLFRVYTLAPDSIRTISDKVWRDIEKSFKVGDNITLINKLLDLELFPVKDGYLPYLRRDRSAITRNPQTVNRICGRVKELGIDKLYERITEPKETNRQMGPLFRKWLDSGAIGVTPCSVEEFQSSESNAILRGTDSALRDFAANFLGFRRKDGKGFDLIARFNGKYVVGEAKFITDEGGHQNDQFLDAMTTVNTPAPSNVIPIAVLDGVLYIRSRKKIHSAITKKDVSVMSALLLRDFLYSL